MAGGSIPATTILLAKYITQASIPASLIPSPFLPPAPPADLTTAAAAAFAAHDATPYALTHWFFILLRPIPFAPPSLAFNLEPSVSGSMDRFLRSRLTRSIIFHNQSPTTAAPPTPIGDDTHKPLLTFQHDDDNLLCIHALITDLEHGAYLDGCCPP